MSGLQPGGARLRPAWPPLAVRRCKVKAPPRAAPPAFLVSIASVAQMLLRTPLHGRHRALGARLVPFAGWEMPVQYAGVIEEHRAVRMDAGVFDVSHMGEI